MKLIDAIKHKGRPFEIPNCKRKDLPGFFVELGFEKGVEIGIYRSDFTRCFAREGLEIYGVDPWVYSKDYYPQQMTDQKQEGLYQHVKRKLSRYPNAHIIRKTSMEALKDFEDESIDFVYIDGNHGLKFVTEDVHGWTKKVKKGGIISGHDYALITDPNLPERPPVIQVKIAVDAYVKAFKIKKWYILGRNEKRPGEVREEWRSWMWFKE